MLCIATGGTILAIAATTFTLSWTHSVEHTEWRESWSIVNNGLQVIDATVRGSGAGIWLPDGAVKTAEGWVFKPTLPPLPRLLLAASGATPSGWTLCTEGGCRELGSSTGDRIEIWSAPVCQEEAH